MFKTQTLIENVVSIIDCGKGTGRGGWKMNWPEQKPVSGNGIRYISCFWKAVTRNIRKCLSER
jgi:hypothetical protein